MDLRANAWKGVVIDKPGKGVPARSAPLVKPAPSAGAYFVIRSFTLGKTDSILFQGARPAHAPSSSNRPGAGPGASSRDGWELVLPPLMTTFFILFLFFPAYLWKGRKP